MDNSTPTHARYFIDHNNARHLLEQHGHNLKYVPTWGWLIWDGKRWLRDRSNLIISLARETILTSPSTLPPVTYGNMLPRIKAMLTLASSEPTLAAQPSQFDTHPFLLNVSNGTLDLRTGELKPHDPNDFITRLIPVEYQPGAASPIWDTFLDQITNGDTALRQYLQRAIGYTLTGSTREETFFILYGPGRNGKSRFLAAISSIMGDYLQHLPSNAFTRTSPLTTLASLTSIRFVTMTETAFDQTLDLNTIKRITSGEPLVTSTVKGALPLQPQFKLWLATNNRPTIPEPSIAIWQRIKLIPFSASFVGCEDKELSEKLDTVLPAILAWAVQGCLLWRQSGWQEPACVKQAIAAYRSEQDELVDFFIECCVVGPDRRVKARELYTIYEVWSPLRGLKTLSETVFGSKVLAHGYQRERKKSGNIYCGISLLDKLASLAQERLGKTTPAPKTVSPTFSGDFIMPKFEDLVY
jgi:putative DNA primase/helicase